MKHLIGVDLGTSATKTIMMNEKGEIVASASYAYPLYEPANGWAEQDPHDWKEAVLTTIRKWWTSRKSQKKMWRESDFPDRCTGL